MSVRVASDEKAVYMAARADHARRVADGIRQLTRDEQIAHVRSWLDRARAVRRAVQSAERTVNARARNRTRPVSLEELLTEAARKAATSDADAERGIVAAREYLSSESRMFEPHVIAGSAMWVAATSALPASSQWPLANAEHLLVGAGMYAFGARTFLPQHVAVLALAELGHSTGRIADALGLDPARVREVLRG